MRSSMNKMVPTDPPREETDARSSQIQPIFLMFVCVNVCACMVETKQKQSAAMFKGKTTTSRVFPLSDVRQMDVSSAPNQAASGRWSLASKLMKHLLAKVTTLNLNDFLR